MPEHITFEVVQGVGISTTVVIERVTLTGPNPMAAGVVPAVGDGSVQIKSDQQVAGPRINIFS